MAKDNAIAAKLPSIDDLFGGTSDAALSREANESAIVHVEIDQISPFPDHPFKVKMDEEMDKLSESIKQYGVLMPVIVRPKSDGNYEMIAGHRRQLASKLAGLSEIPAIVRELDDDEAIVLMCDSNLQRERILFSERAWAYKLKYDAQKRLAGRPAKNSSPMARNFFGVETAAIIGQDQGESKDQVYRYIRLTELIEPLLDLVDAEKIAFRPAVELSYLKKEEQIDLLELLTLEESTPSLAQAIALKKLSQSGQLSPEKMLELIQTPKPNQAQKITFKPQEVDAYFPKNYTPKQRHDLIIDLLKKWHRNRDRENSR